MLSRLCLLAAIAAIGAGALASQATPTPPVRSELAFSDSNPLAGVCPFLVTVDSNVTLTLHELLDQRGNVKEWLGQVVEIDTFTANGKSLTGAPVSFSFRALFDAGGAFTHFFEAGVLARVPLPDGTVFLGAGRVDFVLNGSPTFSFTPDRGTSGNVARFCLALSP